MTAQAPDTTALDDAPVLVHVTRGGFVESAHRATLVATDAAGGTPLRHGRVDDPVLPRSSLKPIQALAMVRHGLDLPPHLLALVCSSHSAEQVHREGAAEILATVGLDLSALRNTPALPLGELEHARWLAGGRGPEPVAQDCSGKHAGFLTWTRHAKAGPEYHEPDHPLQQAVRAAFEEVTGEPSPGYGIDGCSAPNFATSVKAWIDLQEPGHMGAFADTLVDILFNGLLTGGKLPERLEFPQLPQA